MQIGLSCPNVSLHWLTLVWVVMNVKCRHGLFYFLLVEYFSFPAGVCRLLVRSRDSSSQLSVLLRC